MKKPKNSIAAAVPFPPLSYNHPFWAEWKKTKSRVTAYSPDLTRATGSLTAGILLSQILYWFGPTPKGKTKLKVHKHGYVWLSKSREEWQEETGLSFRQIKSAQDHLVDLGIIKVALHRFDGLTHNHLRINQDVLLELLKSLPPKKPKKKGYSEASAGGGDFVDAGNEHPP